jgi:hypothetical protein
MRKGKRNVLRLNCKVISEIISKIFEVIDGKMFKL